MNSCIVRTNLRVRTIQLGIKTLIIDLNESISLCLNDSMHYLSFFLATRPISIECEKVRKTFDFHLIFI